MRLKKSDWEDRETGDAVDKIFVTNQHRFESSYGARAKRRVNCTSLMVWITDSPDDTDFTDEAFLCNPLIR